MSSNDLLARPPRFAAWCVELFAAPHEADGILGDLEEEFSGAVVQEGLRQANHRYRRQALRTIRDLALAPWRRPTSSADTWSARGLLLALAMGVIGVAAGWPIGWGIDAVARALVVRYPVYSYVPAAWLWNGVFLLEPVMTGLIVALIARSFRLRPMSVAVAMLAVVAIWIAVDVPIMVWLYGPPPHARITFADLLVRWLRGVVTFGGLQLLGAAIGRTIPLRTKTLRPAS
jgi:hypothetical protein